MTERKTPATKFAEGIFFNEMGVCGIKLSDNAKFLGTWVAAERSMEAQFFFRSERSRDRILEEISIQPARALKARGALVELPIGAVATRIRDAGKLIGVEVIERYRLAKAVAAIIVKLDATIVGMSNAQRKALNSEFKQARIKATEEGLKPSPYTTWIVQRVGSMLQSGARDKTNFSRFLGEDTGT